MERTKAAVTLTWQVQHVYTAIEGRAAAVVESPTGTVSTRRVPTVRRVFPADDDLNRASL